MGANPVRSLVRVPVGALRAAWPQMIGKMKSNRDSIDFSISPSLSGALDVLRSLAAFLVVINHIGEVLFVFDQNLDPFNLFMFQFLYLGHHSVMILFVVSGFLIGRAAVQCFTKKGQSLFDYGVDRVTRIYVVLIPALIIGFLSDRILLHIYAGPEFDYVGLRTGWLIFLGNILGLQTIVVPTFGSNGPLWSLACELWYYFMFPIFLAALLGGSLLRRLIALVAFVGALFIVSDDILHYGSIWCLGLLCWLPKRALLPKWLAWVLMIGFLASANNDWLWANGWGFPHIAGTALSVGLIINSHRHDRAPGKANGLTFSNFFAKFTYSLYLYHYPPLMIVMAFLLKNDFVPYGHIGVSEALEMLALLIALYGYSYAWFWVTERKYYEFRDYVRAKAAPLKRFVASRA